MNWLPLGALDSTSCERRKNNDNNNNNNNCKEHAYWAQSESFIRSKQPIKVMDSALMFDELNSRKPSRICV